VTSDSEVRPWEHVCGLVLNFTTRPSRPEHANSKAHEGLAVPRQHLDEDVDQRPCRPVWNSTVVQQLVEVGQEAAADSRHPCDSANYVEQESLEPIYIYIYNNYPSATLPRSGSL